MCLTYILKKPTLEKTLGKNQKTQKNPGFLGFFKILGFCPTLEALQMPTTRTFKKQKSEVISEIAFKIKKRY